MSKASIVIPVYNAEKTLSYCLDSVLNQTYQDFEIILVNDGSTDNSQKIIEKYKKRYPSKIKSYTQKNSGIATTRNNGIKYSSGKYIFFMDNDDYIDEKYIETFVTAIENFDVDMVVGGYQRIDLDRNKILFKRDALDSNWTKYMILAPWARVYKKESLIKNNLRFLDINIGEDIYMNVLANLKLKVKTINYNGYRWVFNKTSVSNSKQKGFKKTIDFLPLLNHVYTDTKKINKTEEESLLLELCFLKTCIYYLLHSGKGVEYLKMKETKDEIFEWLRTHFPNYKKNKYISPFTPKGESFSTRIVIWMYVLLQKLHLENAFLWIYSKI